MGGDIKHKTSKIRMSSPKLEVIFRPNSQNQTFFCPKLGGLQKKKKVFTEIERGFSAEIGNSNVFFAPNRVVSKKKKKVFTEIKSGLLDEILRLRLVGGMHPEMVPH